MCWNWERDFQNTLKDHEKHHGILATLLFFFLRKTKKRLTFDEIVQFSLNFAVDATHLNKIGALSARTGEGLGGGHVPQRLTRYKLAATYVPKGKSSAVMVESEPLQMLAFTFFKFSFESSKEKNVGVGKKNISFPRKHRGGWVEIFIRLLYYCSFWRVV